MRQDTKFETFVLLMVLAFWIFMAAQPWILAFRGF